MLPYGRQQITDEDIAAVSEALRSDYLTTGPLIAEFERRFADYLGAAEAVAVCNGTAALHLAMLAAGVGPGDRVVTSPNTFLASANAAAYVGATPDFADIDPVTCNLCPQKLEQIWTADVKAVVPVHYGGAPADMDAISQLARRHGAMIIEDACHAIGGSILVDGQPVKIGATPYADMTTFSLHPVKTITSGEGGLIVTQNSQLAARLRQLRTHGMTRQIESTVGLGLPSYDERGPWYYEMQQLGYNYRITDFQCALGISQLARLDDYVRRRREIVARYNAAFADHPYFILPTVSRAQEQPHTSWHLYTLRIDFESLSKTRTEVMNMLREQGIGTQVLYIPVYLQPWYRQTYGYQAGKCPQAELFYRQALSLPLYPTMTDGDVDYVIQNMLQSCEC